MGNFLKAWIGIKNYALLAARAEDAYAKQLEESKKDLNLLSTLLSTAPVHALKALGCKPNALVFLENVNLKNPRLFDLPFSTQMTPLGFGTAFRFGDVPQNAHILGVTIDRVLLKNDDFLTLDDALASKLLASLLREGYSAILQDSGDVKQGNNALMKGAFDLLFRKSLKEERFGRACYKMDPLLLFGHYHKTAGKVFLADNPHGFDLKHPHDPDKNVFWDISRSKDSGEAFFELVKVMRKINSAFYIQRDNVSGMNLSLFSLSKEDAAFLVVDYAKASTLAPGSADHLGALIQLRPTASGVTLGKMLCRMVVDLDSTLEKYRQSGSLNECLALDVKLKNL